MRFLFTNKIKKVLTDKKNSDNIIFAVAETGSYLDGNTNNDLKFNSNDIQKSC